VGHSDPHGAQQARNAGDSKKVTPPEEMVRVIILNTEQGVFTGNMDYLRALIAAYNQEKYAVSVLADSTKGLLARAEAAEEEVRNLKAQLAAPVSGSVEPTFGVTPQTEDGAVVWTEPGLVPAEQGKDSIGQ
jgi:hypothetical protein